MEYMINLCLQCFDICWLGDRKGIWSAKTFASEPLRILSWMLK